jgi:hypothetical protein
LPLTSNEVTMLSIDIVRTADSQIVEMWNQEDVLGMILPAASPSWLRRLLLERRLIERAVEEATRRAKKEMKKEVDADAKEIEREIDAM